MSQRSEAPHISMRELQERLKQTRRDEVIKTKKATARLVPLETAGLIQQLPTPPSSHDVRKTARNVRTKQLLKEHEANESDKKDSSRRAPKGAMTARGLTREDLKHTTRQPIGGPSHSQQQQQQEPPIAETLNTRPPFHGQVADEVKAIAKKGCPCTTIPERYWVRRREVTLRNNEIGVFDDTVGFLSVQDFPSVQSHLVNPGAAEEAEEDVVEHQGSKKKRKHSVKLGASMKTMERGLASPSHKEPEHHIATRDGTAIASNFRDEVFFVGNVLDSMRRNVSKSKHPFTCPSVELTTELSLLAATLNEAARMSYGFCIHFSGLLTYIADQSHQVASTLEHNAVADHHKTERLTKELAEEREITASLKSKLDDELYNVANAKRLLSDAKEELLKLRLQLNESGGTGTSSGDGVAGAIGVGKARDQATANFQQQVAERMATSFGTEQGYVFSHDRIESKRLERRQLQNKLHPKECVDAAVDCSDLYYEVKTKPKHSNAAPLTLDTTAATTAGSSGVSSFAFSPHLQPHNSFFGGNRMADVVNAVLATQKKPQSIYAPGSMIGSRMKDILNKQRTMGLGSRGGGTVERRPIASRERDSVPLGEKLEDIGNATMTTTIVDFGSTSNNVAALSGSVIRASSKSPLSSSQMSPITAERSTRKAGKKKGKKKVDSDDAQKKAIIPTATTECQTSDDVVVITAEDYKELLRLRAEQEAREGGGVEITENDLELPDEGPDEQAEEEEAQRRRMLAAAQQPEDLTLLDEDATQIPPHLRRMMEQGRRRSEAATVVAADGGALGSAGVGLGDFSLRSNGGTSVPDVRESSVIIGDTTATMRTVGVNTAASQATPGSIAALNNDDALRGKEEWRRQMRLAEGNQPPPAASSRFSTSPQRHGGGRRGTVTAVPTKPTRIRRVPLPCDFETALQAYTLCSETTRPKSLQWLNATLLEVFRQVDPLRLDTDAFGATTVAFFRAKYGLDKMAFRYLMDLLGNCKSHIPTSLRCFAFVQFGHLTQHVGVEPCFDAFNRTSFSIYILALNLILRMTNFRTIKEVEVGAFMLSEVQVQHIFECLFFDPLFECASISPEAVDGDPESLLRSTVGDHQRARASRSLPEAPAGDDQLLGVEAGATMNSSEETPSNLKRSVSRTSSKSRSVTPFRQNNSGEAAVPLALSRDELKSRVMELELPEAWCKVAATASTADASKPLPPSPKRRLSISSATSGSPNPYNMDEFLVRLVCAFPAHIHPLVEHAAAVAAVDHGSLAPWAV